MPLRDSPYGISVFSYRKSLLLVEPAQALGLAADLKTNKDSLTTERMDEKFLKKGGENS